VEKALDTRSSMGVIGDMNKYQQYQMGTAMLEAASNPAGGGMGEGMGLGMGFAMANRMAQAPGMTGAVQAAPPPPPTSVWHIAVNGQTTGPFDDQQIVGAIQRGELKPTSHIWTPALGGWTQAGQVPQLSGYFAAATPPPPPPAM
jgi:hypothetical protein